MLNGIRVILGAGVMRLEMELLVWSVSTYCDDGDFNFRFFGRGVGRLHLLVPGLSSHFFPFNLLLTPVRVWEMATRFIVASGTLEVYYIDCVSCALQCWPVLSLSRQRRC
jgi:hypothetical protein